LKTVYNYDRTACGQTGVGPGLAEGLPFRNGSFVDAVLGTLTAACIIGKIGGRGFKNAFGLAPGSRVVVFVDNDFDCLRAIRLFDYFPELYRAVGHILSKALARLWVCLVR